MKLDILTLVASFILVADAVTIPSSQTYVLHEKREAPLKRWVKKSKVDPRATLSMRIGLIQSNLHNGMGEKLIDEM